ncbi:MAG: hypothetical protein H7842_01220 [Gammaproteobacteria bacterium SHHR-1]
MSMTDYPEPEVWRRQADTAPASTVTRVAKAHARSSAKAAQQLPWQRQAVNPAWVGDRSASAAGQARQQLSEAAQVILRLGRPVHPETAAKPAPQQGRPQALGQGPQREAAAIPPPRPRPVSVFQRKRPKAEAAGRPVAGQVQMQVQRQAQVRSGAGYAQVGAEIGGGARQLLSGTTQILCGTLHGVTATGRYSLDGVLAGTRLTLGGALAAGRYSLLGVRYALHDSLSLARGALGRICPEPKASPEKC